MTSEESCEDWWESSSVGRGPALTSPRFGLGADKFGSAVFCSAPTYGLISSVSDVVAMLTSDTVSLVPHFSFDWISLARENEKSGRHSFGVNCDFYILFMLKLDEAVASSLSSSSHSIGPDDSQQQRSNSSCKIVA